MPQAMRAAENENVFRRVNERLEELGSVHGTISFSCECADLECRERIALAADAYEHVRAAPNRFVVVVGHERPDVEHVVERRDGYAVVEKTGEAGAVAAGDDPRA
jgi:hypothetical protein